jgi:hypothetical protein
VNSPLDQMTQACINRCRVGFPAADVRQLGICLLACSKPTKEACSGVCGRPLGADPGLLGLTAAEAVTCGLACDQLCPATVVPATQLTNLACCVTPPLICGSKGTSETQAGILGRLIMLNRFVLKLERRSLIITCKQ